MNSLLHTLLAFALALGVLVLVHELGHYFVARACGVKVLGFSLGFGPRVWSRRFGRDQTEWMISAIPLGGFVRMLDEREGDVAPAELARAFNRQSPWRRIAIVIAGPLANFLLAIVLYWGLFIYGVEEPRAWLGAPPAATAAAEAGVVAGERVLRVGDTPVDTWQEASWALLQQSLEQPVLDLEVIDGQSHITLRRLDLAAVRAAGWEGDALARLGLVPGRPHVLPVVAQVGPESTAAAAGVEVGDRFLSINGRDVDDWMEVVQTVRASPGQVLLAKVERAGQTVEMRIAIASERRGDGTVGRIGITVRADDASGEAWTTTVRYSPVRALSRALSETWEKSVFSLQMMGRMLTGDVSWRNLSGPVSIASYAGQSAAMGADYYLRFLALVSLSLGVLNLLPVPILDGGHLLYYLAEIIRRAPLSERAMESGQRAGMALLLMLMAFALYNDFSRLFSG
ncbi:RIP metalloprotease RseP [Rhodocyclus tenuis]|uniref:Zinc metalloprotease n=1 Tax=Rhodocyclus gracilis TaxID=2929842 RepID=A0ABX0WDU2_9RHOO|nr:RIP metalloprotease RseP [Rhodocyclus gracilis]